MVTRGEVWGIRGGMGTGGEVWGPEVRCGDQR